MKRKGKLLNKIKEEIIILTTSNKSDQTIEYKIKELQKIRNSIMNSASIIHINLHGSETIKYKRDRLYKTIDLLGK